MQNTELAEGTIVELVSDVPVAYIGRTLPTGTRGRITRHMVNGAQELVSYPWRPGGWRLVIRRDLFREVAA